MIMRSLQPRFAIHLIGFPHVDFGYLVGLWPKSSPSDSKGKKPAIGQRSRDISVAKPRPLRYCQTIGQTSGVYYLPSPHVQYKPSFPSKPMSPTYLFPVSQPLNLHYAYHQGPGHDTDRCSTMRHAIQDLIDQGLINLGQPSVITNPLPTHTTHLMSPPIGDDSHEIIRVTQDFSIPAPHGDTFAPFILWPEDVDVQVMTRSGIIAQVAPLVTRPFGGTDSLKEGLIHMMIADRATCIVFSTDDLQSKGSDHTCPLYITVVCSGHRVLSVLLDNGSTLNVCPLATTVALGFSPLDFEKGHGTLTIDLLIGPTTFSILFQVLRILALFNLFLG
ncbi:hypothetical protein AAG906_030910 [Vitis piasezkii]